MKLPIYQIDAFTNEAFKGNSAAVVPLDSWLPDAVMQSIALENNLSETVFFVPAADGAADTFDIRWFSPIKEIDFCGHATLASAYVIFGKNPGISVIKFVAKAVGTLSAVKLPDGLIEMSFPKRSPEPLSSIPASLLEGLSIPPQEALKNQQAYFAVYDTEEEVRAVVPDLRKLVALGPLDVVVTAPGVHHDFVSRYFWPANGGDEDPVTGSIHAGLAPFWAGRLGKTDLLALQVSQRTGLLKCRVEADRVHVAGAAVQYLEGTIEVPSV
ncbi:PhzF family phenazine biosynthesis protein [Herbaspirillum autotrophicum]|uniref:PhzF family phenazine biosynthesis protein n=1 Tax=Herbaspirillum autotrophicum TaxID=180195 RepID=UPI00067D9D4B|nr:PhzF family phenazine biosynthesis protein [Herbaspirillum autotrophicum]